MKLTPGQEYLKAELEKRFIIGKTYTDAFGAKVKLVEFVLDEKLKPLTCKNLETGKPCFYHIKQLK